jgi:serine/threonine protein kinase/WD40 repeat protein
MNEESLFAAAIELPPGEERDAFLTKNCEHDVGLRDRLQRLLAAHDRSAGLLESNAGAGVSGRDAAFAPTLLRNVSPGEGAGAIIAGRYKLIESIGEGGMGSVWLAQQMEPVKRLVALKLIKAGMDTKALLSRFEAERQALALMDHPNIAKVLDAGATAEGRPFFVMELVKGIPITRYCDERHFTLRQRLDLFIPVCQAVQHAHQKGVIHRDLKPSNVLVAQYDDHPVPKVIDFGVAKAAGQPLTDRTLVTGFGAVVGTPEYMSPEQAQFNQLDVDTRSDIYSLGVLLYELLTGSTPVNRSELEQAGILEVLRLVREQEPPRPSTRLSSSATLPAIAAARGSEPHAIAGILRNDLDWIVMKSLEKDRNRRYETATGLAADISRYLSGEAVLAHPPSTVYRLRKFVRKHRVAIVTAAGFLGLLVASVAVSGLLAVQARRNFEQANEARGKLANALDESQLTSSSLQIDADLENLETTDLLRLASTRKSLGTSGEGAPSTSSLKIRRRELGEFATLAILAAGQAYVPLVSPCSRVGFEIKQFLHNKKGDRYVTLGEDGTARLWDPFAAGEIAVLKRGDERALNIGFSNDGTTLYTHALDGIVRFWRAKDGGFRTECTPVPDIRESIDPFPSDLSKWKFAGQLIDVELDGDRVLTRRRIYSANINENGVPSEESHGPLELWDVNTGRHLALLEPKQERYLSYSFVGDGRWIFEQEWSGGSIKIVSAADGLPVATLKIDPNQGRMETLRVSPDGRYAVGLSAVDASPIVSYTSYLGLVQVWDTGSWQMTDSKGPIRVFPSLSRTPPVLIEWGAPNRFRLPSHQSEATISPSGSLIVSPLTERDSRPTKNGFSCDALQVYDASTGRRLKPPKGRKSHPEISRFAPDGRLMAYEDGWSFDSGTPNLYDTIADKSVIRPSLSNFHDPKRGWWWFDTMTSPVRRLPRLDQLDISPELLELWVQVALRGELNDEGLFSKWDEDTWEAKRQELASQPVPYPDFPFPGYVATDRLHWLRAEFDNANDTDKPLLAKQLLAKAQAVHDKAEVIRVQNWMATNLKQTGPKNSETNP